MTRHTNWRDVPVLLTVAETARIADVHYNTIYNLVKSGQLKAKKIGREWRISKTDLMDYLGLGENFNSARLREACRSLLMYLELLRPVTPDSAPEWLSPAKHQKFPEIGWLSELTQELREALADSADA